MSLLVQELEGACELPLQAMTKVALAGIDIVGDLSLYMVAGLRGVVPRLSHSLAGSRKYFTQFCLKFVTAFITKFLSHLYKCRPVGTEGAEQLLLDTHSTKTSLLSVVPGMELAAGEREAPQVYTKGAAQGCNRYSRAQGELCRAVQGVGC